ncbi:MAG: hypothetical protein JEY97_15665 [Bacteroidales bacterium]|nr:hypothetical protein [Bacteroidales bacterium]
MSIDKEIKVRGQIIALNLRLEDLITKILYKFFLPQQSDEIIKNLYLNEFILPMQYGKKIDLFKKIIKSEIYRNKIEKYIQSGSDFLKNRGITTIEEFDNFLGRSLSNVIKHRNMVAHGFNISELASETIELRDEDIILANKLNPERLSMDSLKELSQEIITIEWIISKLQEY